MSIATKRGDGGETGLAGGIRVSKSSQGCPLKPAGRNDFV